MSTSIIPDRTEVGNYFVANYPPFSVWTRRRSKQSQAGARVAPRRHVPLGLYLHIPFCRKRCHFCYFRVYTDKNASEVQCVPRRRSPANGSSTTEQRAIAGRPLNFVYFGGGTPSYISTRQLEGLVTRMDAVSSWRSAEEITFECEPGTLTESKLAAIRDIGVTRLSLGIENFDDAILEANGRAHRSPEIGKAYAVRAVDRASRRSTSTSSPACSARPTRTGSRASRRRSRWRPTASPSTRWSCRSTRRSARTC